MSLFFSMSVQLVVGTKRARWGFTGWSSAKIDVPHSEVTIEGFHQFAEAICVDQFPYVVGRDASTVLSVVEVSRRYRQAPRVQTVLPLTCVHLGSDSHPEYHGGVVARNVGQIGSSFNADLVCQAWVLGDFEAYSMSKACWLRMCRRLTQAKSRI
jgi:hypothetical protein